MCCVRLYEMKDVNGADVAYEREQPEVEQK